VRVSTIGVCRVCGLGVAAGASFVNTGPTDWNDQAKPHSVRWVPVDEDIHGWTPFVITHPACFAREQSVEALVQLVDESHRFMRQRLTR
jgi:hypothetical protein